MRTKKLKTATGRTDLPSLPDRVITFEEAEARTLFAKFGAEDKASYIQKIDKMTDFDLSNHAQSVGVRPVSERSRIRTALIAAFENIKGKAGSIARASAVETTSVKRIISDNYEDFINKFRPVT